MPLHHYEVVGRKAPTKLDPSPQIYRMRIFGRNETHAKSRFWYFLHTMDKLKRSTGQVLAVHEIREKNDLEVKTYGITIRYNSRSGTHNMYKQYVDTTLCGAVEQMYQELSGRHRARFSTIHIVDTCVVVEEEKTAEQIEEDEKDGRVEEAMRFPLPHRIQRPSQKKFKTTFKAQRPTTFFS